MQARHRVTLVSSIALVGPDGPILAGKKRALALLVYLLQSPPHRETRAHLAALLWQDKSAAQTMSSLRQTLLDIRRAIPDGSGPVEIGRQDIVLSPTEFETDFDEIIAAARLGDVSPDLLGRQALCDRLLEEFIGISDAYDQWIAEFRATAEARLKAALSEVAADTGKPADARIDAARALIQLDPFSEEGCRWLMQIYAERGETGAALQAYAALYDRLDDELGMEPSEQTQDLAVRIKTGGIAPPAPAPVPASPIMQPMQSGAPKIAVMPFRNLGPDDAPDFLLQGIADDIVCMMATLRDVQVISTNSTGFVQTDYPHGAAEALGAQYAVLGSIRATRGRFHLSAQLVELSNKVVHWARAYSAEQATLFDVQADIARSIANTLVPSLHGVELRRTFGAKPGDLTAYHLTLHARDLAFALREDTFTEARDLLQTAITRDPTFAPAHVALADWYSVLLGQGWSQQSDQDVRALELAASDAVRLSGDSGRALALYAHNRTIYRREAQRSAGVVRQALELAPSDSETLMWSVPTLTYSGNVGQAVDNANAAISLSPRDPYLFRYEHFLAMALYAQGDISDAANAAKRSYDLNPGYTSNLRLTVAALWEAGRADEARALAQEAIQRDPAFRVERFLPNQPFHEQQIGQRYAQSLTKAGIPE
ncbi:BTAD domain-containing putative transcriptional regulator [Pseudoprimorskyibacter insulae]|uniref:Bacterial transcriptional activator domain-containing protein n=1 Tax=Pseudoprimorskyibacter insulae TaxID=1695997 RepID=A0A2R8B0N5_9RHOB|nr:BTAD domain-containing putative transcriptional regulator [Pseudoprimorskyibacter insulae]SPF81855.1 hypothetical protein PRI8871_03681 [Pseudoprimorskyibacter insulae]